MLIRSNRRTVEIEFSIPKHPTNEKNYLVTQARADRSRSQAGTGCHNLDVHARFRGAAILQRQFDLLEGDIGFHSAAIVLMPTRVSSLSDTRAVKHR